LGLAAPTVSVGLNVRCPFISEEEFAAMAKSRFVASDGTKAIFREPLPNDAAQLMEFINEIIDEPKSGLLMNKPVTLKQERKWLKDRLKEIADAETVMLLVEVGGRVRGSCSVNRRRWKESHKGNIGIALSREMRGKGVGEALMRKTVELASKRMRGLEMLDLAAFRYNKRALALYRKLGFVRVGRIPDSVKDGDVYSDEEIMILRLREKR